jgi:Holliday junction resolvasome RuvABC ATP-dependent DNA helicase subunit
MVREGHIRRVEGWRMMVRRVRIRRVVRRVARRVARRVRDTMVCHHHHQITDRTIGDPPIVKRK